MALNGMSAAARTPLPGVERPQEVFELAFQDLDPGLESAIVAPQHADLPPVGGQGRFKHGNPAFGVSLHRHSLP